MSTAHALRIILDRLGASATVLLAILLDLPTVPEWCDGQDADGRVVLLVGRHNLGTSDAAQNAVRAVLTSLRAGTVPEGVHAIAYAPKASAFLAEALAGDAAEILADGPRESGKTQAVPAILAALAELHARAGFRLPLVSLWVHNALVSASLKTGGSLEQELWGGLWSLRDDRREAVLMIAGVEMVRAYFVGCLDQTAAERLRAECHVLAAEELIPSLDDAGGIEERKYDLGVSSMRLETRRHVAISTTNPGDLDCWPYKRWIQGGGRPDCVRCQIPASDRMTPERVAALRASFRDSPDLERRLALGEWVALTIGEAVAVGFRSELHVAPRRLDALPGMPLVMGHDAGLTPVTVIGQEVGGEVRILAALASDRAGTRQHLEALVIPWLAVHAPWAMRGTFSDVIHHYDCAMDTPDESNLESSPLRVLREVLGGATFPGPVSWPGRRDPLLTLLNRLNPFTGRPVLQLCPEGCQPLIQSLSGRWYYPTVNGKVSRELPAKTHPASDLGDALCYFVAGLVPAMQTDARTPEDRHARTAFAPFGPFNRPSIFDAQGTHAPH